MSEMDRNRRFAAESRWPWFTALVVLAGAAGCSSASNPATGNHDDAGQTGDDDVTTGDDEAGQTGDDDATTGDDDSAAPPGTHPDAAADAAPPSHDASPDSGPVYDGGLGASCISALYDQYVRRWDGALIWEQTPASPATVVEATTGTPLKGIVNVQQGQYSGCAALTDGGAECWQQDASNGNVQGQLGNGTTTAVAAVYRATPVLTAANTPLANVKAMATGNAAYTNTACAVTTDGKLWCWGDLSWIVDKGTATLYSGYAQAITTDGMTALTGVSQAALSKDTACALVAGSPNSVWCWGYNGYGDLGQGDTTVRQYPTKVLGLTNPTKVVLSTSANGNASTPCALDGANVRCWGYNGNGETGTNTTANPVSSATAVVTQNGVLLGGVTDIEAGYGAFAVLRTDQTIWTWGYRNQIYATNFGLTNVLAIGWAGPTTNNGPRYLTSDGVYHSAMTTVSVNCNAM
jgi:Regulator of chromosome condensation (RCC1) repeat